MYSKTINAIPLIPLLIITPMMLMGLSSMSNISSLGGIFWKQLIWIVIAIVSLIIFYNFDYKSLPRSKVSIYVYLFSTSLLLAVFVIGKVTNGAQSWLHLGVVSFQPADLMKLALIMLLAKYFSHRHREIANVKHLFISGFYFLIPFILVLLQPDLGSALILLSIWGGIIFVSGASRKHIIFLIIVATISFALAWSFAFKPYQKARIVNFIHPLNDIKGGGYNAYQSTIAVGNGGAWGQGIGYGSQSRLNYLPEHETDFIFAAFLEEWGFMGGLTLITLYLLLLVYLISGIYKLENNYSIIFISGLIIWLYIHIIINMGMNLGVAPVTGIPLPFVSYGGTHLLLESIMLGMAASMLRSSNKHY